MPMYVYSCQECERRFEVRQRFQDDPLTECDACGGGVRRVLQPVGIVFKGSGFYSTDYKSGDVATPGSTNGSNEGLSGRSGSDKPQEPPPAPAKEVATAGSSESSSNSSSP